MNNEKVNPGRGPIAFARNHAASIGAVIAIFVLGVGIMAVNGWLPNTDWVSGKKTGWFGKELSKNASSSWNPLAAVLPTATPTPLQLAKENIYAGSRLLSVVDANAQEVPPADLAVWRPGSTGIWYVMGPGGTISAAAGWGTTWDKPQLGDFDGDGKTDFCVIRPATFTWYIIYSSNNAMGGGPFGTSGDIPVAADYDGDGKTDIAVYRPSTGIWYWLKSSDANAAQYASFGLSTDLPVPTDYDGDGKADISIWRPSDHTFYTLRSSDNSLQSASFGATGDVPVPGDYDGDGKANYALRSGASWLIYDNVSTAQTGASIGYVGGGVAGAIIGAGAGIAGSQADHINTESRDPTPDEMNTMVDEIRYRFQQTYGQAAYEQAVSETERRATTERLARRGTGGMLVR